MKKLPEQTSDWEVHNAWLEQEEYWIGDLKGFLTFFWILEKSQIRDRD